MPAIPNFPNHVWIGKSQSRKDGLATQAPPDWSDWEQLVAELVAVQTLVLQLLHLLQSPKVSQTFSMSQKAAYSIIRSSKQTLNIIQSVNVITRRNIVEQQVFQIVQSVRTNVSRSKSNQQVLTFLQRVNANCFRNRGASHTLNIIQTVKVVHVRNQARTQTFIMNQSAKGTTKK